MTPRGFRHALRVRLGDLHGPRGVLYACQGGTYWRVRLSDSGDWVAPIGVVVDGPGTVIQPACQECGLPFVGTVGDVVCAGCQFLIFGGDAWDPVDAIKPDAPRRGSYRRRGWH